MQLGSGVSVSLGARDDEPGSKPGLGLLDATHRLENLPTHEVHRHVVRVPSAQLFEGRDRLFVPRKAAIFHRQPVPSEGIYARRGDFEQKFESPTHEWVGHSTTARCRAAMRYHSDMAVCSQCGAARPPSQSPSALSAPCAKCGAVPPSLPELELATPARSLPKPPRPRKEVEELQIDLAYDPRSYGAAEAAPSPSSSGAQARSVSHASSSLPARPPVPVRPPVSARPLEVRPVHVSIGPPGAGSDVRLLADYGDVPSHWLLSPIYAVRVLKRRRELRRALAARKEEAARAAAEAEDALVAAAEQVRTVAEQQATFADVMSALRRAEELLRMRDRVLTAENEAEMARLASADARLSKLETDCASAQTTEREAATELVAAQEALVREEAHLKRTETELRSAQREPSGTRE